MAKTSVIVRNEKRQKIVNKYWRKRQELKQKINNPASQEALQIALQEFQKLPRNASPIRLRNRCAITGRPRGVYRKFKLCRHKIRELACYGLVPGLLKSSW